MHRSNRGFLSLPLSLSLSLSVPILWTRRDSPRFFETSSFLCFSVGKSVHGEYIAAVRSVEASAICSRNNRRSVHFRTLRDEYRNTERKVDVHIYTHTHTHKCTYIRRRYGVYAIRCRPSHQGERTLALGAIHVAATAWRISYCVCRNGDISRQRS